MASIGFLIAFIASFLVYNDAKRRGHEFGSALLWALGTLAMMIVVLPLYLIFGRRSQLKKHKDPRVIDIEATVVNESYINCTMCGARVNDDFNVCPYCGYSLRPKCSHCGQALQRETKICFNCHNPVDGK